MNSDTPNFFALSLNHLFLNGIFKKKAKKLICLFLFEKIFLFGLQLNHSDVVKSSSVYGVFTKNYVFINDICTKLYLTTLSSLSNVFSIISAEYFLTLLNHNKTP